MGRPIICRALLRLFVPVSRRPVGTVGAVRVNLVQLVQGGSSWCCEGESGTVGTYCEGASGTPVGALDAAGV